VLVAKNTAVHAALQRQMTRNGMEKDYFAVVKGKPAPARGTIDLALRRDASDRRRVVVCDRGGQQSVTRYRRLTVSRDGTLASVLCRLVTGRTHQIRVHLAAKGWPIVGDRVYGTSDPRIDRQALHAWQLAFVHPRTRARMTAVAPIAPDIAALFEASEASDDSAE
jgi:23S rRNA pseudouridine1911/1915/1917 synthase